MIKPGKLSISRRDDGEIWIEVIDVDSGVMTMGLTVKPEEFAFALTGMARMPCDVEWNVDRLGMTRETKVERIPLIGGSDQDLLAPYCVDGWEPRKGDLRNHHNHADGKATVVFTRWV